MSTPPGSVVNIEEIGSTPLGWHSFTQQRTPLLSPSPHVLQLDEEAVPITIRRVARRLDFESAASSKGVKKFAKGLTTPEWISEGRQGLSSDRFGYLDLPPDVRSDISARVQKMNRRIAKARQRFSDRRSAPKRKFERPIYGLADRRRWSAMAAAKRPRLADPQWEVE